MRAVDNSLLEDNEFYNNFIVPTLRGKLQWLFVAMLLSVHFVHKASKLETSSTSHLEYKPLSLTHQGREKLMIQLLFSSCKNEKDEN